MHNNLNILEMKPVLELQPFIPNANRLNIWQLNTLKDNLTPNCGSICERGTGSNIINVLKGGSWGLCPPGAKAFLITEGHD